METVEGVDDWARLLASGYKVTTLGKLLAKHQGGRLGRVFRNDP